MKRFILIAVGLVGVASLALLSRCDFDFNPGVKAKFGNFGGGQQRAAGAPEPMNWQATEFGIRWFPTHVHFGPDGDTLLVSLCHVSRPEFCRIGKYMISQDHWDILPFEQYRTYRWPIMSPDGQWIVYSTTPCTQEALCDGRDMKLARMSPDGAKTEIVADTLAISPSFSADGKKLIYWRRHIIVKPGQPKFAGGMNLYQMDWATEKETALTDLTLMPGDQFGKPFFLPDGQRFLFQVDPEVFRLVGAPEEMFKSSVFLIGSMKNVPITAKNYDTLEIIKKDSGLSYPCDMDRQGRVLYLWDLGEKKRAGDPVALALRPADPAYPDDLARIRAVDKAQEAEKHEKPLTDDQYRRGDAVARFHKSQIETSADYLKGEGSALFLRGPNPDARDEGAFDGGGCVTGSLSRDGKVLAFVQPGVPLPSPNMAIGLIGQGEPLRQLRFILNWPKLDVNPTPPATH